MHYSDQKPTNADGDSAGQLLAFNRDTRRWYTVGWNVVDGKRWSDWEKLPEAPAEREEEVTPAEPAPEQPEAPTQ